MQNLKTWSSNTKHVYSSRSLDTDPTVVPAGLWLGNQLR